MPDPPHEKSRPSLPPAAKIRCTPGISGTIRISPAPCTMSMGVEWVIMNGMLTLALVEQVPVVTI